MSSTAHCVFCKSALDDDTKPEHILLNALGGRKTTRCVVCSTCNNRFGSGIDKALAEQVAVLRNLLQLPSGTRKAPPAIPRLNAGSQTITLQSDGTPKLVGKPFTLTRRDDGTVEVAIVAHSEAELPDIASHVAAALDIPLEHVQEQLLRSHARRVEYRPGPIHTPFSFGGTEAVRAITKACLVLWATLVGNEEVSSDAYDVARQFVIGGSDEFNQSRSSLDSRAFPNAAAIEEEFGPLFNIIVVASDSAGRVIGHFTMYNAVAFQVVLAEGGGAPEKSTALVTNPLNPNSWSERAANELVVPFEWLVAPVHALDQARERVSSLVRHYFETARPREIGRICDSVFSRHGLEENEAVPLHLHDQILAELTDRLAMFTVGLPYEQAISPDQLRRIFAEAQTIERKNSH